MKKFISWLVTALLLVVVIALSLTPTVVEYVAADQYSQRVEGGSLDIDNIDINYFAGQVTLEGVKAVQADQSVMRVGYLLVNVGLFDLLGGHAGVESLELSDFEILADQNKHRLVVAGYEIPLGQAEPVEATEAVNEDAKEVGFIESFGVDQVVLSNVAVRYADQQLNAAFNIKHLSISGFDSSKPEQETQIDLHLGLEGVTLSQSAQTVNITPGAELRAKLRASQLLSQPSLLGSVRLEQLVASVTQMDALALTARVDELTIEDIVMKQLQTLTAQTKIKLGAFDVDYQGKPLQLLAGTEIAVSTSAKALGSAPEAVLDISLQQLDLQAADINTQLLGLESLSAKQVAYTSAGLSLENMELLGLQAIRELQQDTGLARFERLTVSDIQLPELNALNIDSVELAGLDAQVYLNAKRQLAVLQPVLDYFDSPVRQSAQTESSMPSQLEQKVANAQQENQDGPTPPFTVSLNRFFTSSDNHISFKDAGVKPAFARPFILAQLDIGSINTADAANYTTLKLKASAGEYSKLDVVGQLQLLAKNPSGYVKGQIKGVELVPLSPYALDATGYFIRTGQLKTDIDVTLDKAELGGELKVLLSAIKLEAGDKNKMEQMKQQIAMPLDTALGLLRDKNGDVTLDLPMEGNINAPDFSVGSVMGQVSTKVLKKATIVGLKYAFQPYGAMISVGSWLGKKATAVRLDPLQYQPGEQALNDDHKGYLSKVAEIMAKKEGLRIKLCAQTVKAEAEALHKQSLQSDPQATAPAEEKLVELASQRSEVVRDYLVEDHQVNADRLLMCQPSYGGESKEEQSVVYLEI